MVLGGGVLGAWVHHLDPVIVRFGDGPVAVNRFAKNGLLNVEIQTIDDLGLKKLEIGDMIEPVLVERIRLKSLPIGMGNGSLVVDVDGNLDSSAPVPEPGAALLFGAGLFAASVASRRAPAQD